MKNHLVFVLIAAALASGWLSQPNQLSSAQLLPGVAGEDYYLYLPVVHGTHPEGNAIIVDHRHTNVSQIPEAWITVVKNMTVHYAHTSHGSQVLDGLLWLEGRNPSFAVHLQASGPVIHPDLPGALNIYDGNNYAGTTYITPDLYWETASGLDHTRSVANTGWFDISLWTWCGQMSYYSDAQIEQYLYVLAGLQIQHPGVRFIFYTGHTDGSAPGSTLWRHNQRVREYVHQNGGVLFDFADIESYDPSGTFYPTASDSCEWCADWCNAHPAAPACQSPPASCAHTHGLQCTLKGQAFWWLLARIAGWDGRTR